MTVDVERDGAHEPEVGVVAVSGQHAHWWRCLGWSPEHIMEEGRRLASKREWLIAGGTDPADLIVPIAPEE